MKSERCPICDKGVLQREVKNEIFKYNGKSITIPDYIVHRCNQCGEAIVDNATLKESGKTLKAFKRKVDERRL